MYEEVYRSRWLFIPSAECYGTLELITSQKLGALLLANQVLSHINSTQACSALSIRYATINELQYNPKQSNVPVFGYERSANQAYSARTLDDSA